MDPLEISYKIPAGHQLACYSCNAVFKDVLSAADHTMLCVEPPTTLKKLESPGKRRNDSSRVKIPRPPRTWSREYEAIFLQCMRDNVEIIGQAKAKIGKRPYTIVMEEVTRQLQESIGEWVNRKAVVKKWLSLQRRARNYDVLHKKNEMLGYLNLDPPEFYGSIKEIEKEIDNVKMRVLKKLNSRTIKDGTVDEAIAEDARDNCTTNMIQECKVEADGEYVVGASPQERRCIEVIDIGNTMIRKDIVLSILNRIEQDRAGPAEVAHEFGIDEFFLDLIKQKKEFILQGVERCSLCHLLLGNKKDLVSHELQCLGRNKWTGSLPDDENEEDSNFQFLPATVDRLVQLVIDTNPRQNRRNTWKKITFHLSSLQEGVTMKRCHQKWRNLVNQCRSYEQLEKWAKAHNYTHSRPLPDYYNLIMPYINACEARKGRPSFDAIRKFVSTSNDSGREDEGNGDDSNDFNEVGHEDNEDGTADFEAGELNESCEHSGVLPTTMKASAKSKSSPENPIRVVNPSHMPQRKFIGEQNSDSIHVESGNDINVALDTVKEQSNHINKLENKLDNALVLLRDLSRENLRLTRLVEARQDPNIAVIGEKISKLAQIQSDVQKQTGKQFEKMMAMWERHHQENQATLKALTTEIGRKNVAKVVIAKPGDQICNKKTAEPENQLPEKRIKRRKIIND